MPQHLYESLDFDLEESSSSSSSTSSEDGKAQDNPLAKALLTSDDSADMQVRDCELVWREAPTVAGGRGSGLFLLSFSFTIFR